MWCIPEGYARACRRVVSGNEQANIASARLNVLLDRAPETAIGPLVEPPEQTPLPPPVDLQRLAIARQPELQRARVEIESAASAVASRSGSNSWVSAGAVHKE